MLRAKGKDAHFDMVRNIIPGGVKCIFMRHAEQLSLGHAVLRAKPAIRGVPLSGLLANDFHRDHERGMTMNLAKAFANSGKS